MIGTILGIIIIIITGYTLLRILNIDIFESIVEEIPYYFATGVGCIALQMYLYSRVGIPWGWYLIAGPWLILFTSVLLFKKYSLKLLPNLKLTRVGKVFLFINITLLLFVGFESVIRPLSAWDSWSIWLLKSKIFFIDGLIKPEIFTYVESDYPLAISLTGTFIYQVIGRVDDTSVLLLFFSFYLMLGIALFFSMRKYTGSTLAMTFTFLFLATQNILRHGGRYEAGQADLALGFYFFISAVLLYRYIITKERKSLLLCNICLGITALIKNEGITFVIIAQVIIIIQVLKTKKYKDILFSLLCIVPIVDWYIYKEVINMPKNFLLISPTIYIGRIGILLKEFLKEFLDLVRWNLLWALFILTTILNLSKSRKILIFYYLLFGQLAVYFLIYLITPINPIEHLRSSLNRLLIHLAPIAIIIMAIIISNIVGKTNNKLLKKHLKKLF